MNVESGRADLLAWREQSTSNFYTDDVDLQRTLRTRLGKDRLAAETDRLKIAGAMVATELAPLAELTNEDENLPRLDRFDELGVRTEQVVFHPSYHDAGRHIWNTRILADYAKPGNETVQMALLQLFAEVGENGHNCPLACTAGLIKVLQRVGNEEQQARLLPGLLDPDYTTRIHGSQFLTEIQGGSDVGSNSAIATPNDDGSWRIDGEKWFCSVVDAQLFLVTARPEGAATGTRGLGLFVVPRTIDGKTNGFEVRRLKKKLGTRAMASAEIDFVGARAELVGELDQGFKNVVEHVLNTSRIYNAVCCAGAMRAAYRVAHGFAQHRRAFGQVIAEFPLVSEALARLRCEAMAATASSFRLAAQADAIALGKASETQKGAWRAGVNINKYWTAVRNTQMVRLAMEILGGNGAIETFSPLVRLYRDAMVLESWEGAHNVLVQQVLRDAHRYQVHEAFMTDLKQSLEALKLKPGASAARERALEGISALADGFNRIGGGEGDQRYGRALMDQAAALLQVVALLEEHASAVSVSGTDAASLAGAEMLLDLFVKGRLDPPPAIPAALLT